MKRLTLVQVGEFVEARQNEIQEMYKLIRDQDKKGKRVFQRLPRYKRRRAMSWNIHLLPKRLRKSAEKETLPARIKHRKRRKFKRRKLISEKKPKRLTTHIFHAKRMHMEEKFGYLLAVDACLKIYRATYKFQRQHCTIYDSSYYNCLEFTSKDKKYIMEALKPLGPNKIDFFQYTSGEREGELIIYENYPLGCVGPANFQWKQASEKENSQLWIWVHPLMKEKVLSLIKLNNNVKLKERDDLIRFELRGPQSTQSLNSVLDPNKTSLPESLHTWKNIQNLKHPDSLPRNMVLSLSVNDPMKEYTRLNIQAQNETDQDRLIADIPENIAISDLWKNEKSDNVFIIQKHYQGFGSGFDFICHKDYGVHIWSKLSKLSKVLSLSLNDRNRMLLEHSIPRFPLDYPDSSTYRQDNQLIIGDQKNFFINRGVDNSGGYYKVEILFLWCGVPKENSMILKIKKQTTKAVKKTDEDYESLGFITSGLYSLSQGKGFAIGFSKEKFTKFKKNATPNVLIFHPKDQYLYPAFARITNE